MGESDVLVLSTSIYIIGFISFMGDMARGVLFPVLWRLCQHLGGSTVELGYLVASFSFGRMVFGPYLGYVCDKYSSKRSLLIASFILMIGSILWAMSYPTGTIGTLFVAQFLLGCGSGSLGVTRAYVIDKCPKKRLTEVMAYMNALQFAGFTVSPILGSGLSVIGPGFWKYFFPPLAITAASIASMYMIVVLLDDITPSTSSPLPAPSSNSQLELSEAAATSKANDCEPSSDVEECRVSTGRTISTQNLIVGISSDYASSLPTTPPCPVAAALGMGNQKCCFIVMSDMTAVYIALIIINVIARGSIAVYETMSSQVSNDLYNMSAVTLGMIISLAGTVGTLQLVFFKSIWGNSGLSDTHMMLIGTIVMAVASLVIFDYEYEMKNKPEGYIPMWRFITALVLVYSVGYPIAQTAVLGAFSKVKKHGTQGQLQSWFATAGSISRVILPILSGYIETIETNGTFSVVFLLLALSAICLSVSKSKIDRFTIDDADKATNKEKMVPYINMSYSETAIVLIATGAVAFSVWALT